MITLAIILLWMNVAFDLFAAFTLSEEKKTFALGLTVVLQVIPAATLTAHFVK